tara:strand:+ start:217 stop:1485 length:1269 start_codon:yes stop_codon:yes gene_type:complete
MKKYILILAAAAITGGVSAQKNKVVSAYNYDKAFTRSGKCKEIVSGVEAINMAIEHDQTKNWAKTWYYRGNLYFKILASKDNECKVIDLDALDKCTDSYLKALVLNFDDSELKKLDLQKEDGSDLIKFSAALKNNPRLDDDSYTDKILGRKIPGLAGEYANQGISKFGSKDYKGAQEDFGKSMLLSQLTGRLDTMLMYNTALASEYAQDYENAKLVYNELIMMKYNVDGAGPDLYKSMSKIYKKEENNEKAVEYISQGRMAYPDDNSLLVLELEGFLQSGNNDQALANLNTGITNDPTNAVLYFARGTVYENLKDQDNAVADYKKAIELNPDYYDASFNLGAYYFNSGADKINQSNKLPLSKVKEYDAFKAEAKKYFEAAVPHIATAHRIKPGDGATGDMLINLYTQTGQYEKAKEVRAKFE